MDAIKNRVDAINKLNTAANALLPQLMRYFSTSDVKTKANGDFYAKNQKEINEILKPYSDDLHRCYIDNGYSVWLKLAVRYEESAQGWGYIDRDFYICDGNYTPDNDYHPAELIDVDDYRQTLNDIHRIESDIQQLKYQLNRLRTKYIIKF